MLDLTGDQLRIISSVLSAQVPGAEAWAFGSRVKGTARPYSDLDITIAATEPLSLLAKGLLKSAFEESDLPFRVECLDWHTLSEEFKNVIKDQRVRLNAPPYF